MKKHYILSVACAAVLFASCSELSFDAENVKPANNGVPTAITASFEALEAPAATKVSFKDPNNKDYTGVWKIGEIIKVSNVWCGAEDVVTVKYKVVSITDGKASFELVEGEDVSRFSPDSTVYYAHFGYSSKDCGYISSASGHVGEFKSVIETHSILNANNVGDDLVGFAKATISEDGKLDFSFKNILCYLKVTMPTPCEFTQIKIATSLSGGNMPTGFACIGIDKDGMPISWTRTSGGSGNASYKPASGSTFQAGATYYLPIWPGRTIAKGKKFQCYIGSDHQDVALPTALTTKRNTVINLGTIVLPE